MKPMKIIIEFTDKRIVIRPAKRKIPSVATTEYRIVLTKTIKFR
ncbi:hypothetical protein Ccel_3113 [Ruminiclostridium cellulolyticum H10]|uniref:Uncharacterized protein n=1 Tax=Ruminiclostridium cellulolyticum (strain ATCC 35319 / DSM 5812 / JCM 6584 / H10) TaxID=394503 RepID=B8I078_RUMCH|nr:hypothetical protein Ccel_3113 [Ruminiclostridium cellulolyticum H10]